MHLEDQVEELEDDNSTLRLELRKAKEKMAGLEERARWLVPKSTLH